MGKPLKRCLGILLFTLLLAAGVHLAELALYPMNDITRGWAAFYRLERDSVDTLIVGSSHAYSSFDPERFTQATGQTAYILAGSSQITAQSYDNVREALAYQKPKTILLETFGLNNNDLWQNAQDNDRVWQKESNVDGMRFGLTKLEAVAAQYRPENWVYALFPIIRCHTGWADNRRLQENWQFYHRDVWDFPCFRPSKSAMTQESMDAYAAMEPQTQERYIAQCNRDALHDLAALCRKEDIRLVLVMAPMYDVYIRSFNYDSWVEKIAALAEEEGLEFLDCNRHYDEIGLTAQDFEDGVSTYHHTNRSGAEKVTDFVLEALYGQED